MDVCVFTITDDRISEAIVRAHQRKVAIRVISDNDKAFDPGSDIDRLRRLGVDVRAGSDQERNHLGVSAHDGQVQRRGMELNHLDVADLRTGMVGNGNAVTGGHRRIGGVGEDMSDSSGSEQHGPGADRDVRR